MHPGAWICRSAAPKMSNLVTMLECPMQHDILLVHTNGHNYFMIARRAIMIEGLSFIAIELSEIAKYMVIAFPFPLFSNFLLVVVVYIINHQGARNSRNSLGKI
jgi:hypothetical protein